MSGLRRFGIESDSRSHRMVKCPYCDTEFDLDTLKAYEEQLSEEEAEQKDCYLRTGRTETAGSEWQGEA